MPYIKYVNIKKLSRILNHFLQFIENHFQDYIHTHYEISFFLASICLTMSSVRCTYHEHPKASTCICGHPVSSDDPGARAYHLELHNSDIHVFHSETNHKH